MRGITLILALSLASCGGTQKFVGDDPDGSPDVVSDVTHEADVAADPGIDVEPDGEPDVSPDGPGSDCGNGVPEAGEDCDDGNGVDGDGCDNDCTWSCERNWECADEDFCTSDVCDTVSHTCTHEAIDCTDTDDCTVDGCDPGSGCTHERMPDWYRDADGDSYGDASEVRCATSAPEGHTDNDDDCRDTNPDINPGVTSWFTERHYCTSTYGNFDYNCDGTDERRWSGIGSCASSSGGACVATPGWESSTSGPPCGYTWRWITACHFDSMTGECVATTMDRTQECR